MGFKHDEQGFLVGSRLDESDLIDKLDEIKSEIAGMRRDLSIPTPGSIDSASGVPGQVLMPLGISDAANPAAPVVPATPVNPAAPVVPETPANPAAPVAPATPVAVPGGRVRDSNGRFIKADSAEGESKNGSNNNSDGDSNSPLNIMAAKVAISDLKDGIAGAIGDAGINEESDPSVKAFNEVAKPLQRGFGKIFGDDKADEDTRWYRRFWRGMRKSRKIEKKRHKEQIDILEDIEEQGGDGKRGGILGLLSPLLGLLAGLIKALVPLKLLNSLPKLLGGGGARGSRRAGRTKAARARSARSATQLGSKSGAKSGVKATASKGPKSNTSTTATKAAKAARAPKSPRAGRIRAAAGAGRGALRRIPLLGLLLTAFSTAREVKASEADESTTRREKDANAGSAIGGGAGALTGAMAGGSLGGSAGAAIGTALLPGIGTAIGGAIGSLAGAIGGAIIGEDAGEVIGAQFGEWVSDLRESDIGSSMISKWNVTTDFVGHLWGQASDAASSKWESASTAVSEKWGAVTSSVSESWDLATEKFSTVADSISSKWDSAVDTMQSAWGSVTELASEWWGSVKDVANKANDWIAEKTGVDVKQTVKDVADSASESYDGAKEAVKSYIQKAKEALAAGLDSVKGAAAKGVSAVGEATGVSGAVRAVKRSADYATNKEALRQGMANAGITDPTEMAMFMGQMDHESGGLTSLDESFNYRSADRVMAVSGTAKRKGSDAVNAAMQQGPEAVAELMYGGRMGNVNEGDAYAFRGRGFTQLTGRDNYTKASEDLGIDLVNNPDLASDPDVAAKIATWYWQSRPGLAEAGRAGDVEAVTKKINGGTNGLADRKAKTAQYQKEIAAGSFSAPPKQKAVEPPSVELAKEAKSEVASASPEVDVEEPLTREQALAEQAEMLAWAEAEDAKERAVTQGGPTVPVNTASSMDFSMMMPDAFAPPSPVAEGVPPAIRRASPPSPRMPSVPETPQIQAPLASNKGREGGKSANHDVSRDLSDRRIAHVVTGAYSQL